MTWWARLALAGQRSGNLHEGTVWITIETVDGLEENDLVTAAMEDPAPEDRRDVRADRTQNGRIKLEGPGPEHARADRRAAHA